MNKILTRSFRVNSCFFCFTVQTCRARVITKVAKIVWRVTVTDLFVMFIAWTSQKSSKVHKITSRSLAIVLM